MDSKNDSLCQKDFNFELKVKESTFKLEIPINIPFEELRVREYAQRIMTSFDLPIFLENEIEEKLRAFVEKENFDYNMKIVEDNIISGHGERNSKEWEKSFREEALKYSPPETVGDDEVFAEAYHSLVHSPLLGTLLRKESALNSSIREFHRLKNEEIFSLNERQNVEMSNAISTLTANEINRLAAMHFEKAHMVRTKWQSIIESENLKQKNDYRNWIMKTYQDFYISEELQQQSSAAAGSTSTGEKITKGGKKKLSVRFDETLMISYGNEEKEETTADDTLQESFTIHLGSQMKQTYNIRLFCCHPIDFLRFRNERSSGISPQRLQTAISIYSSDISGIVILADPNFSLNYGIVKDIAELGQQTTEFHFGTLESQLENKPKLKPGDFLISKHSNLNGAQVIFYLIGDEKLLQNAELNSRDPVILGLRNILKIACLNDITTITIPALLTNEMTDEMKPQWLNRRAELVYKCVKGFMIEMGSWGGAEMKNLQFIAPRELTEEVFTSLSSMLPNIFRVSTPLRLSSSSSGHSLHAQLTHQSSSAT